MTGTAEHDSLHFQDGLAARCRLCDGDSGESLQVREMMIGTREVFRYFQCRRCGCLQIETIPDDIARFYGSGYYSYDKRRHKRFKRARRALRRRLIMTGSSVIAGMLSLLSSPDPLFRMYRNMGIRLTSRVLDVGAGSGGHVLDLRDAGVVAAVGIDPLLDKDVVVENRILVYRRAIDQMDGEFDIVTFHHSLEHVPDQIGTLQHARRLLAAGGRILVRVPTVTSEAYETYRENWVNLDAPRHFFLHSHNSLNLVASRAGLKINKLWCDSTDMQFMASEQYMRDMPLMDARSAAITKRHSMFSGSQRRAYAKRARQVNRALKGDSICAVMSVDMDAQSK